MTFFSFEFWGVVFILSVLFLTVYFIGEDWDDEDDYNNFDQNGNDRGV